MGRGKWGAEPVPTPAPVELRPAIIRPATGRLIFEGHAPTVRVRFRWRVTTHAPLVLASRRQIVEPQTGHAELSAYAPTIRISVDRALRNVDDLEAILMLFEAVRA